MVTGLFLCYNVNEPQMKMRVLTVRCRVFLILTSLHHQTNDELFDITTDTYAEFRHFPDRRKEVFRDILVSKATFDILSKANAATDLIKESKKIAPPS